MEPKDLKLIGGARKIETQSTSTAMQHKHRKKFILGVKDVGDQWHNQHGHCNSPN